jgi:hypothetical protein
MRVVVAQWIERRCDSTGGGRFESYQPYAPRLALQFVAQRQAFFTISLPTERGTNHPKFTCRRDVSYCV